MKHLLVLLLVISLTGCGNMQPPAVTDPPATRPSAPQEGPGWSVYDPDPAHPWNRVFRQLYQRSAADGEEYGADELDPLLWLDTTHLLNGSSYLQARRVLDQFLSVGAEDLVQDPLKRAMFQRDLWAVFDWLASRAEPYPGQREALQARLAEVMKRVSLSEEEIRSLPDNYALAVHNGVYPAAFQTDRPEEAFLPPDLFGSNSAWVPMGREGGPAAMTHTEAFPFFGRSVFLVFVRSPEGREATLDFIETLSSGAIPVTVPGSEVALVRRMLLIDARGELVLSPLVETIQVRHFNPLQTFYEFELERTRLFDGIAGGLVPKEELFMLFMGHGDVFNIPDRTHLRAAIPDICKACHFEFLPVPHSGATRSIISYSRHPFSLPDNSRPVLFATTVEDEAQTVKVWKRDHATWRALESFWEKTR